jgi:zinc-ribbon domain
MAFCNSCGANLDPSAKFCAKCGATVAPGSVATGAAVRPPAPTQTRSGLKTLLIVVGVLVGLGVLGIAAATFIGLGIARRTHVETNGKNVRVETPFGTVESTKDPAAAARNLGVEVYPGAQTVGDNAAAVTMGKMKTVNAEFETSDPPGKVFEFYKKKYPRATVTSANEGRYTIVATGDSTVVTINIESNGDRTRFQITNVAGKSPDKSDPD